MRPANPSLHAYFDRLVASPTGRALVGTVVGSVPGFLLPFVLSAAFGVGRVTDIYFYSLAIANFSTALLTVVLEANVLPVAQQHLERGPGALAAFVRNTERQAAGLGLLSYLPVALIGITATVARSAWSHSDKVTSVLCIGILGFYVVACAVASVRAAACFARDDFLVPMLSQGARALLPMLLVGFTAEDSTGLLILAGAVAVGEAARALLLGRRIGLRSAGEGRVDVGRLWPNVFAHAGSMIIISANPVVDRLVAAPLKAGSLTLLDLAEKILYAPLLAITSSMILVSGTRWARATDPEVLREDFRRSSVRVVAVATVVTVLLGAAVVVASAFAGPTIFGFSASGARAVVLLLLAGLPAAVLLNLAARLLTAIQRTSVLPALAALAFVVNLAGDLIGSALAQIQGIAAASTLVRYLTAAIYVGVIARILASVVLGPTRSETSTSSIPSSAAAHEREHS